MWVIFVFEDFPQNQDPMQYEWEGFKGASHLLRYKEMKNSILKVSATKNLIPIALGNENRVSLNI